MTIAFGKLPLRTSRLFVPALLVGALLLPACSKSPAQIEKKDLGLGHHYLSEGKVNEAIIEFQNVLKVNPKSVKGRLGLATAYLRKGWTAEGVLEFQEVSKEDPLNLDAHLALARYGVNSGQWNAVNPEIAAILKIDPNNVEGLSASGERDLALGHEKEAEESFRKALSISPGAVGALVGMGDLLRHESDPKQAADYYNRALASDPKNARALTGLGSLAQAAGKPDEAKEDFRKAIAADKSDLRARIVYANFLAGQGHADQAIALLKAVPQKAADLRIPVKIAEFEVLLGQNAKAIALMHPLELQKIPLPDIYLVLAKAYQNSGRIPEAVDEATKLSTMDGVAPVMKIVAARVELAGRNPGKSKEILNSIKGVPHLPVTYWATEALVDLAQDKPAKAIRAIDTGLALYPDDPQLLQVKSDAQIQGKQLREAIKTVQDLISKNPKNPNYIARMGILISRTKGKDEMVAYYRENAKKNPDNPALESLYLLALSTGNKLPKAISETKDYLSHHPGITSIEMLLADFYLQSNQKEKSLALYRKVLDQDPKNLQAILFLASNDLHSGKYSEAESLYRRALLEVPDNANIQANLGETLLAEKQNEAANAVFKKSLDSNPNQPISLIELSKANILSGNSQKALTYLSPLIKKSFPPEQKAQVQWLWGLANEKTGNINVALDALQMAVRLSPKNAVYRESLGEYWASLSRWDKALSEFEKSQAFDSKNALLGIETEWAKIRTTKGSPDPIRLEKIIQKTSAYRKVHPGDLFSGLIEARAEILLKKNDQALAVYDILLSTHPGNSRILLGKANILYVQGHVKQAKELLVKLLSQRPDDLGGNLLMASIDQKVNDLHGAVDHLGKVHQLFPRWVGPALSLATDDLSLGRFEEARSVSFTLYEAHPDLFSALYVRASAEMGLGDYRNAERDFVSLARHEKKAGPFFNLASIAAGKSGDSESEKRYLDLAFKNSPNDPIILNNMAFSMADRNDNLPKALSYANKALKRVQNPVIQDTVGYILFLMGKYNQAQPYFSEAYKANFRNPEFLYHMGLNEWKLGNKNHAKTLLQKAVNSGKLSSIENQEAHRTLDKLSGDF